MTSTPKDRRPESLGARIRFARRTAVLSQAELAAQVGVTQGTVSDWETGKTTDIGIAALRRIAAVTGRTVTWLVGAEGGRKTGSAEPFDADSDMPYDPPEGPGWLWEEPSAVEEQFRSYIRSVEYTVRGMVGDPDQVKIKELRLITIDLARLSARSAGRPIPPFIQQIENEIIAGTFR